MCSFSAAPATQLPLVGKAFQVAEAAKPRSEVASRSDAASVAIEVARAPRRMPVARFLQLSLLVTLRSWIFMVSGGGETGGVSGVLGWWKRWAGACSAWDQASDTAFRVGCFSVGVSKVSHRFFRNRPVPSSPTSCFFGNLFKRLRIPKSAVDEKMSGPFSRTYSIWSLAMHFGSNGSQSL